MSGFSTARSEGTASGVSWAKSSTKEHGYLRSESRKGPVEYELRHKVGPSSYVKTDIESQIYFEREIAEDAPPSPTIPTASLRHPGAWNTVECQIKDEIELREALEGTGNC